ncbi:alpha/beta-hydrolase [Acaromyces ingoldii]|uniref:Alpha/beta-hydrolase n=1 Tax=Acaromyces ingoldii TaxID=215250 RepID=A0A316YUT9_9BASI|nr:alpha/beta-hydrolase [Acaromyces ingoldii]PWN91485.1 alpha/beta-hydrolase [Acaromyces ingoldii]
MARTEAVPGDSAFPSRGGAAGAAGGSTSGGSGSGSLPRVRPRCSEHPRIMCLATPAPNRTTSTPPAILSSRFRLRLALASSFVAAWLHFTQHGPTSERVQDAAALIPKEVDSNDEVISERTGYPVRNGTRRLLLQQQHQKSRRRGAALPISASLDASGRPIWTTSQPRRTSSVRSFSSDATATAAKRDSEPTPEELVHSSASKERKGSEGAEALDQVTDINKLMWHPDLLKDIKAPRHPIVLCHGLYGFDVRGPFLGLEIHYWASVLDVLRKKVGAEVIVRGVPGTGAIADRALALHKFLMSPEAGLRGKKINFIGHSMGGLDARHVISVIKPDTKGEYEPVSLTTVATPHRGSPFMDWCNANVGTGNERVETEIREARERLKEQGTSAHVGALDHDGQVKVPYSLKTPLFVRPKQDKSSGNDAEKPEPQQPKQQQQQQQQQASAEVQKAKEEPATKIAEDQGTVADVKEYVGDAAEKLTASVVAAATSPAGASPNVEATASSLSSSPTKDKKKSKSDGSSILDFTAFTKALSSIGGSFSAYMLSVLDQPAYAMLSTRYMAQAFNPSVPNSPKVAYYSVAARTRRLSIWHPLWLPKLVLDAAAESRSAGGERDGSGDALGKETQGNDGLVSVESAKWGHFMGVVDGCDHWDLRGGGAPRWRGRINPATGKAWAKDPSKEEEIKQKKAKEKEESWIDINKILGRLVGDSKKKKDGKGSNGTNEEREAVKEGEKEEQPSNAAVAKAKAGFMDEVAGWISDRLPQRDESRRAEAERVADEQDRKQIRMEQRLQQQEQMREEEQHEQQQQEQQQEPQKQHEQQEQQEQHEQQEQQEGDRAEDKKTDGLATEAVSDQTFTQAARIQTKLRREAAWEEELGHLQRARELRRELAWHRAEWDRTRASSEGAASGKDGDGPKRSTPRELDWDAHAKQRQSSAPAKAATEAQKVEANELERFWIAICRHLWAQGF